MNAIAPTHGTCPCCGQALPPATTLAWDRESGELKWSTGAARLRRIPAKIFDRLWRSPGILITREQLWICCYGDREDGGPEPKTLEVHICRIRAQLMDSPVLIETLHCRGYRLTVIDRPVRDVAAEPIDFKGAERRRWDQFDELAKGRA